MVRVRDDLFVLDLGVVSRKEPDEAAHPAPAGSTDKCQARMRAALTMHAAIEAGEARNLAEAGRPFGFGVTLACKTLRLLRLAPDLIEAVLGGEASVLPMRDLQRLTVHDDFDVQRRAYARLLDAARAQPDGRRGHPAGRRSAAPPAPPTLSVPVQVRAVISFNPAQWADQKETSDRHLAEIRAWTRRANQRLLDPRHPPSPDEVVAAAWQRLRRDHLVECFTVQLQTTAVNERQRPQIAVELKPEVWRLRQRFHGFLVHVAQPDERRPPADMVTLFRAKDKVEKDFQTIKSVLRLRPVRHHNDAKVRAHVTLCMLALLVQRVLDQALAGKASAPAALEILSEIHLNRLQTPHAALPVYALTRPKRSQLDLLDALQLSALARDNEVTATLHPR